MQATALSFSQTTTALGCVYSTVRPVREVKRKAGGLGMHGEATTTKMSDCQGPGKAGASVSALKVCGQMLGEKEVKQLKDEKDCAMPKDDLEHLSSGA